MEDKANLEARIATAEKVEDLSKRIEATQRILDGKTEKAVTVKAGFSAASAQTDWMGKIYYYVLVVNNFTAMRFTTALVIKK